MRMFASDCRACASTTLNRISGDRPLGLGDKLRYFVSCISDNYLGRVPEARGYIPLVPMELPPLKQVEAQLCLTSSPSRFYSDILWRSLPWAKIRDALGEVIVLELGCGRGSRFRLFSEVLGVSLERYIGVDMCLHSAWSTLQREDIRARFVQMRAEDVSNGILAQANLVVSQSVLEHVEGDLEFFRAHFSATHAGKAVIQIHIVPSVASLFLYLWHGYRQYSPHALAQVAALYTDSRCALIHLGGVWSNLLHLLTITLPSLLHLPQLRQVGESPYAFLLRACYARERVLRSRFPSFYALVVETGFERPILEC